MFLSHVEYGDAGNLESFLRSNHRVGINQDYFIKARFTLEK